MGIIALSGIVVNNAIVFMDFFNHAKADGCSIKESILVAAKERIRPIFLTTMTTVVGILPTAYGLGGLDPFVVPIALSLGWGILGGAFLNLALPADCFECVCCFYRFSLLWVDGAARIPEIRSLAQTPRKEN